QNTVANSNYAITYTGANLVIGQLAVAVNADAKSKTYGDVDPALTFVSVPAVGSSLANGGTISFTGALSRAPGEEVASYAINQNTVANSNYAITYTGANLVIGQLAVAVNADAKAKYCGQVNPALTFVSSPVVGSVLANGAVISFTGALSRVPGESAGTYAINKNTVANSNYNIAYNTASFTINGVNIDASASSAPVALGSSATLSATVTSAVSGDLSGIPVVFTLDNGNGSPIIYPTVTTDSNGLATYSVSGLAVEVYKITAAAGSGCASSTAYLAIYDPNGGFVTGGGWINSPTGAYYANTALTGKANFGFNAKYKKGSTQVDGNTEFQFQTGNLNFSSSSHDAMSLVIAGAQAIYKGKGTINGVSGYSFMVSAIDGNRKTTVVPDKFRIKI
ncbi:MAG: MBG domain-containing protein, partial [Candidatus Saccharibacteria bacterium]|nr:MBG domain-containing protein [Candidatus Saccharibacteria bacterium]